MIQLRSDRPPLCEIEPQQGECVMAQMGIEAEATR